MELATGEYFLKEKEKRQRKEELKKVVHCNSIVKFVNTVIPENSFKISSRFIFHGF